MVYHQNMGVAIIGRYYKTGEAAIEAYEKLSEWNKKNHSVVEFKNAFLIISNETIKALTKKT